MNTQIAYQKKTIVTVDQLNDAIVEGMQNLKAKKIVIIDMRKIYDAPARYFIICEGESNVQVRAITDSIYRHVKESIQTTAAHIEGGTQSTWVVMDYFETVVHVFYRDTRTFYDLEGLWSDGKFTEYADLN